MLVKTMKCNAIFYLAFEIKNENSGLINSLFDPLIVIGGIEWEEKWKKQTESGNKIMCDTFLGNNLHSYYNLHL